jgi:hypothetical protein
VSFKQSKLTDKHSWKSKPGYSICVLDRGLVRFEFPENWVVKPEGNAVHLHDRPPSLESCDLGVSIFHVPAEAIRDFDLDQALRDSLDRERKSYEQSEIYHLAGADFEIVWLEQRYTDAEHGNRDARFRVALVRGPVMCLISMNYWAERAGSLDPVWDHVLASLIFGIPIADPAAGPVVH